MQFPTLTQIITVCIGALVMLIAISAFVLSFTNLQRVAIEIGIPVNISYVWPVCLDAFMVVGSMAILLANIKILPSDPWWGVLILSTGASTLFNIAGADSFKSIAGHAIPPIALCISLEILMWVIRTSTPNARPAQPFCSRALTFVQSLRTCTIPAQLTCNDDPVLSYLRAHPLATDDEVGKALGKHRTTIGRRRRQLIDSGLMVMTSGDK